MRLNILTCSDCFVVFETSKRADTKRCDPCKATKRKSIHNNANRRKEIYSSLRDLIIAAYGGCCACCGEATREFLAIDHIHGGGQAERREKSMRQMMTAIIKADFPDTYRILCHNCNLARGFYGQCPHERTA